MTVVDLGVDRDVDLGQRSAKCSREQAEALGARVMAAAGDVACQESVFLELLGEFDAAGAFGWFDGLRSTAHWVSWACSLAMGTAREHVRVARALRRMPVTRARFAVGELTYSKVRELSRLVDRMTDPEDTEVDEVGLVELARSCTASQLARTVGSYRAVKGTGKARRSRQRVSWQVLDDGTVLVTMVLPPEQGSAFIAAVNAATDAGADKEPEPGDEVPDDAEPGQSEDEVRAAVRERSKVEAVAEIAEHYLTSLPEDRSGEDRTLVVVEVNAEALASPSASAGDDVASVAEPEWQSAQRAPVPEVRGVPAGTSAAAAGAGMRSQVCAVRGAAAVEPATARAALCDGRVLGVIIDERGEPLAVGREQRFATRAQRRALMVRDGCCQYPGCSQRRRLKAHHRVSWLAGGPTDLDNLILLCQWHHTRVHEDEIVIERCDEPGCEVRWCFRRRDGSVIAPKVAGLNARNRWQRVQQAELRERAEELRERYAHVDHLKDPAARRVFPPGGGEGFNLAACVDALFSLTSGPKKTAA